MTYARGDASPIYRVHPLLLQLKKKVGHWVHQGDVVRLACSEGRLFADGRAVVELTCQGFSVYQPTVTTLDCIDCSLPSSPPAMLPF